MGRAGRLLAGLGQHCGRSISDVADIVLEGAHSSENGPRILTLQNHIEILVQLSQDLVILLA